MQLAPAEECTENRCTIQRPPVQTPHPAVVRIENRLTCSNGGFRIDKGSGAWVNISGTIGIITASHIFRDGIGGISVTTPNGNRISATIKKRDEQWDVVFLQTQTLPDVEPLNLASRSPPQGEPTVAWGFGSDGRLLGQRGTVVGYVKTKNSTSPETLMTTGKAREGDSGGPVLDGNGELIGLLWGTDGRYTYSTCVERLKTIIEVNETPRTYPQQKYEKTDENKNSSVKPAVLAAANFLYGLVASDLGKASAALFGIGTPTLLSLYVLRRLLKKMLKTKQPKTTSTTKTNLNDAYAEQLNSLYELSGHSATADATLGRLYDIKLRDAEESSSSEIAKTAKMIRDQVAEQFLRIHSSNPAPTEK